MAVMPGAAYLPINYADVPLMARYDVVCAHTIVGNDPAPAAHFSVRSNGFVTQSRDTAYQSAANYEGNHRVIAIETDDMGPEFGAWNINDGHAVPAWTAAQCEAIARILVWCHRTHGIPLTLAPDSRPTSRGVGYHRQGIDGNFAGYAYGGRVSGGEHWSKVFGKVCPGDRRIRQLIEIVIPRARVLAGLEEDDVSKAEVLEALREFFPGNSSGVAKLPGRHGLEGVDDQYGWTLHAAGHAYRARVAAEAALAAAQAMRGELEQTELDIIAATRQVGADVTPEQLDQLISALRSGLPPAVTPEQIEASLRRVFADAATTS